MGTASALVPSLGFYPAYQHPAVLDSVWKLAGSLVLPSQVIGTAEIPRMLFIVVRWNLKILNPVQVFLGPIL